MSFRLMLQNSLLLSRSMMSNLVYVVVGKPPCPLSACDSTHLWR